jgi:tetratricopeptide (TPR) repeat protein
LLSQGLADSALAAFDEAVRLDPESMHGYWGRAQYYESIGQRTGASDDINRVIFLNPSFMAAHSYRGIMHYEAGEYDAAISDFDIALRINPQSAIARYWRGFSYRETGVHKRALKDFDVFLSLSPDASAYFGRGASRFNLDDLDGALTDFDNAIRLPPPAGQRLRSKGRYLCSWWRDRIRFFGSQLRTGN